MKLKVSSLKGGDVEGDDDEMMMGGEIVGEEKRIRHGHEEKRCVIRDGVCFHKSSQKTKSYKELGNNNTID